MKIALASDIHNEFGVPLEPSEAQRAADVVVLAGDIGVGTKGAQWALEAFPDQQIIYITGNHEYYHHDVLEVDRELADLSYNTSNFHFLDGGAKVIDGVGFIGGTLWTDFNLYGDARYMGSMMLASRNMNDYRLIKRGGKRLMPVDTVEIFNRHFAAIRCHYVALSERKDVDRIVVVTHHAPSEQSVESVFRGDELSPAYASNLESFILNRDIDFWFHGHMHQKRHYRIGSTTVVANPRGYVRKNGEAQETGFDPDLIIDTAKL